MSLYRQKETYHIWLKQSFILLEILIAISIISLLAGFLIYRPFQELQKELELVISIEEDRVWEGELIQIESELRNECSKLPGEKKNAKTKERLFNISLPNMNKKCKRTYKCWTDYNSNDQHNAGYLVHMETKKGKKRKNQPKKLVYKFFIPVKFERPPNGGSTQG